MILERDIHIEFRCVIADFRAGGTEHQPDDSPYLISFLFKSSKYVNFANIISLKTFILLLRHQGCKVHAS